MTGPELTRHQADAELARLDAEQAAISAALVELDSHPGQLLLDGTAPDGETARRWAPAKTALAVLHEQFDAYRAAVERAHQLRSRRELGELTELLRGESVVLSNEAVPLQRRSLTGPSALAERVRLATVVDRMNAAFGQVTAVVAEVEAVWSAVVRRVDPAQERVRAARALAEELSLEPGEGDRELVAELDRLQADVTALRERLAVDPLTLAADAGEQLPARAGALLDRLKRIARVRDGFAGRLTGARAELDRLCAAEAELARTRAAVRAKIADTALPQVSDRSAALRVRIDELAALGAGGRWRRLADELPAVEDEIAAGLQRTRIECEAIGSLLDRRNELRGRLDAYRAKAAGIGHSEDLELERLFGVAHELLWTAPCDLPAATRALARYQQAVSGRKHG